MSKCGSYRKHKGGAIGDGSQAGSGAFAVGSAPDSFGGKVIGSEVSGYTNSQAAQVSIIPQSITGQGMGFQALTSKFHRKRNTRKQRKQRKQRGGGPAPYPDAVGALLPKDMTGPMQLAESGVAGGSGTAKLDDFLVQTRSAVQQFGGGKKQKSRKQSRQGKKQSRKQQKKQQQKKQQQSRTGKKQQQKSQKKQRGGALTMQPGPASGPYTLLSGADLQKAGLNPQWFDENQVNPNFGGAITVPGGK